jgi:cysteine desulfurase
MIYLDNSATTKPDGAVLESFNQVSNKYFANPASIHSFGATSEKLLVKAREQAAQLLQVDTDEVIFTSGGTEGNNMAIKGIALQHQKRGKHIITTEIEHPAVYEACAGLEKLGFSITYLPVNEKGVISVNDVEKAIRDDTILLSVMHVNNEIGSIQPIEEIAKIAKKYPKLFFHVDDVQGVGKVPLQLKDSGVDLCTFSGHKIHGLKGTGLLYVKNGTALFPLFHGGEQEMNIRSGTVNVAGNVAMVKALRLIKEKEAKELDKLEAMKHYLLRELSQMEDVVLNSSAEGAPHIINFSVPGVKPEVLIHMLGEEDIFLSTKSACSSKSKDESKVLAACGFSYERNISGLRVSLSYHNTMEEMKVFIQVLQKAITQFKKALG